METVETFDFGLDLCRTVALTKIIVISTYTPLFYTVIISRTIIIHGIIILHQYCYR